MIEVGTSDDLTGALLRLATDPSRVRSLHGFLGGYCHQARNLLNSLKLSFYLARREHSAASPDLHDLESYYLEVEQFFDRLQTLCRPMSLNPIRASLDLLIQERGARWVEMMEARGHSLELLPPKLAAVGQFDPVRLGDGLDAFARWRADCGEQGRPARLQWKASHGWFLLEWDEPAVGNSGFVTRNDRRLALALALALPLLARVVSAHGGTLVLDDRDRWRLRIRWPLEPSPSTSSDDPC